jgi:hypothetical protein
MDRVNPAGDLDAILAILRSLETSLALARAQGADPELMTELEDTLKEIGRTLRSR